MIYKRKPESFASNFDVVSCFVECNGQILLLHRQDYKPEGNTWGVPAGKVGKGESVLKAMVREMREETGIKVCSSQLAYYRKLYVRYADYDFIYHIFHTRLTDSQKVVINHTEHKGFKWVFPEDSLKMPLITDLDECIRMFYL